ncbi:hypothetical protein OIPHN330_58570 (plasmid) [Citrobacter freundii]|nr:hypothetical protein TMSI_53680 [Klebsiella quasipneumoniae]BBM27957.1 hypothetical protein OIPHN069_44720 [Enterobacter hormaechei subsp. hoffmannii]BEJ37237.1 hypothetical protein OIPHN330_58570 [Citrobacter freundii]BEJ43197.1 hypothetical protein OIPHN354_59090 [Citrobacter freundii]
MVWKANYSPFGKASITSQGPTFNLRFPGQYFDAETGLHYNWRRYYDPNTGRYITSDPIGLVGGINTYAYALSNPMIYTDPTGLWVPQVIGAIVNMGFEGYRQYQAGSFDAGRLLVAGATGAIGGFGSTPLRAILFGATAGATQNTYKQITDRSEASCEATGIDITGLDVNQIVRSALFGGGGGLLGYGGGAIGRNILRTPNIIGEPLGSRAVFNYGNHGAAIGAAGGTAFGNQ